MGVKSCCAICYKKYRPPSPLHDDSSLHHKKVLSDDEKSLLKRFFKLINRYVGIGGESASTSLSSDLKDDSLMERLIDEGITGACGDCFEVVKSFCELYEKMKVIELSLNWKVWTLKNIMYEAHLDQERMKTLKKTVKKRRENTFKDGDEGKQVFRPFKNLKAKLVNHCDQKVLNSYPKLSLQSCDEPSRKPPTKFCCPLCPKGFSRRQYLINHRRKEHKGTALKCSKCDKVFHKLYAFKKHQIAKSCQPHGKSKDYAKLPFPCDICDKKYTHSGSLKDHKRRAHEGLSYKCGYCFYTSRHKATIRKHTQDEHKRPTGGTHLPYKIIELEEKEKSPSPCSSGSIRRSISTSSLKENDDGSEDEANDKISSSPPLKSRLRKRQCK